MSERLEVKNIYSLSPLQQGMLFHSILDSSSYSEQVVMGICGELDIDLLEKSFNKMIERHDIFRTNFIYEKIKKPQQVVLKKRTAKVRYEDLSAMDEGTRISYIEDFAVKDREKGFDLSRDMLIRISVLKKGR
jgi:fengycin family lipopeptide synthetase D